MERNIDMGQTVEEAAHFFAESRSSGSAFLAYYHGFIVYGENAYKVFGEVTHWMPIPDLEE